MSDETLSEIRYDFWSAAFASGKRCGVMRDEHYHPATDRDWMIMFCGGAA